MAHFDMKKVAQSEMHLLMSLHTSAVQQKKAPVRIVQHRVSEFKCEQNTFPQLSHTLTH